MDHGAPVETLLMVPPGAFPNTKDDMSNVPLLLSAGGTTIKVWHPLTGRCLSTIATKHSKAITSLCLTHIISGDSKNVKSSPPRYRILTGGLDGLVRIHVLQKDYDLACVHGHKIPDAAPITAIICSPNQRRIVMGTSLGLVVVYDYPPPKKPLQKKPTPRAGTFGFFQRGTNVEADPDDFVALVEKRKRLRTYDVALRQFRYGDALDTALRSRQPQSVRSKLYHTTCTCLPSLGSQIMYSFDYFFLPGLLFVLFIFGVYLGDGCVRGIGKETGFNRGTVQS
jgi:U3 small nucleolar RNA-associated protein 15